MHNVELKAELRDAALARGILRSIGAVFVLSLRQTDTYFRVASGRLKRRETEGEPVEYIRYERTDRAAPKLSHFSILTEEEALERFGALPLPVRVVVRKKRELWMHGNVRVHLDTVEKLGVFVELEALVSPSCHVVRCHEAINTLRAQLRPAMGELIDCGYADLLERDLEAQGHTAAPPQLPPGSQARPASETSE
jgi:adenylate cyclase class IV